MSDRSVSTSPLSCSPLSWSPPNAAPCRVATRTDDAEVTHLGTLYLRIVGPIYASAGSGLIALCWLDLGVIGVFATMAVGFCAYAALARCSRWKPPASHCEEPFHCLDWKESRRMYRQV
jgi:hypothetical protein